MNQQPAPEASWTAPVLRNLTSTATAEAGKIANVTESKFTCFYDEAKNFVYGCGSGFGPAS